MSKLIRENPKSKVGKLIKPKGRYLYELWNRANNINGIIFVHL